MNYLITGGTGFIGKALVNDLIKADHKVTIVSRRPHKVNVPPGSNVHVVSPADINELDSHIDGVINLAGEPIVDKRWSASRKQALRSSRIDFTEKLIDDLAKLGAKPEVFVSGSAIGYYGSHDSGVPITELGHVAPGFTHELCQDWENVACDAEKKLGSRVCCIRTGIVLGDGGALNKMLPPFRFGLGGPIGSGEQWMSWIHLKDQVAAIKFLLEHDTLYGAYNLTAPGAVTNDEFSQTLGKVLNRPAKLKVPAFVMQLMLGEASELLLEGQRVFPERLDEAGFEFSYPSLEPALRSLL